MELLPTKATFAVGEPVEVEARGIEEDTTVKLLHLERVVAEAALARGATSVSFPAQPEGGYGVEADGASTALDVLVDPLSRPRYGFVSHYETARVAEGVVENVRRFHLNAVQFYDWMYRHATLMPPEDEFEDALGQRLSLDTVRRLASAIKEAGSLPIGYAAVYAVGREAWPEWEAEGLFRGDGSPWMLGDFLWNVDPTNERWVDHLAAELRSALDVGFSGFHLDQYGSPKWALRSDGTRVELADAFPALIDRLAVELQDARLIFNNVNDFPTESTAGANQALIYIEVWAPHDRLGHLAQLVTKAKLLAPEKPVILAAYLSSYQRGEEGASAAELLQLATVFSHGGTVLLHGEERAVLTEAYYVTHKELSAESQEAARRYFDFAVRYGDLLYDRDARDLTRTHLGGENEEVKIDAPVPVATDSAPGVLWSRVIRTSQGLLISLIDLSAQHDDLWDAPKQQAVPLVGVRLSVLRRGRDGSSFAATSPDEPALRPLAVATSERYETVSIPPFRTWSVVLVRERSN